MGRQGSEVSATSLAALAGKRIALVAGYANGEAAKAKDGPIIVGSTSEENRVAKLLDGEVDYTLMDELVIQYIVSNHPEAAQTRLAFGSTHLIIRSLHVAVHRSLPDAESIVSGFNAELRGMIADRSYHRLLHLDWIRVDVDGDGLMEHVPRRDQTGPRAAGAFLRPLRARTPNHGPRDDVALLLRRQHLRRLVERARPVQDLGLYRSRTGATQGRYLHVQILG